MSKPIKELMKKDLAGKLEGVESLAVCDLTGLDAGGTAEIRQRLEEKQINVSVVKNSIARNVFKERGDESIAELFEGPCAIAWGGDSVVDVVRELLDFAKATPQVAVKSAVLSGDVFDGDDAVKALSKYPTRDEAVAQVVQCVISAGSNLASALLGPSGQVGGILKTIEENAPGEAPAEEAPAEEAPAEEALAEEAPVEETPVEEAPAEEAPAEEAPAEEAPAEDQGDEEKAAE